MHLHGSNIATAGRHDKPEKHSGDTTSPERRYHAKEGVLLAHYGKYRYLTGGRGAEPPDARELLEGVRGGTPSNRLRRVAALFMCLRRKPSKMAYG